MGASATENGKWTVFYLYRVDREFAGDFVRIWKAAQAAYLKHGASANRLWRTDEREGRDFSSFHDILEAAGGEDVYLESVEFRDRDHHDTVMARVDQDPEVIRLYKEVAAIINLKTVVRSTFVPV